MHTEKSHTDGRSALIGRPAAVAAGLFLLFLLLRLPFASSYLVNWDAVNFAMGVEEFSLRNHQPHPPGYPGFILLGRALAWLTGDGASALTLLSMVGGALAPAGLYLFGRRVVGRRGALAAAVLMGSSPLLWYYSEVALTYTLEAALTIPVVLLSFTGRKLRSPRRLMAAGLLLACLGAVRQTGAVLLLPALAYGAWGLPWRERLRVAAVTACGILAWLVPLLVTAGGPQSYMRLSRELAELTGGRTWALSGNLGGFLQNLGLVTLGAATGLGAVLVLLPRLLRRLIPDRRALLLTALWAGPALAVYLLVHTGQIGYMLLPLPVVFLWAGRGLERVRSGRLLWQSVTALALANAGLFLLIPPAGYRIVSASGGAPDPRPESAESVPSDSTALPCDVDVASTFRAGARQFDIERNDAHWDAVISFVGDSDPESTAVLTNPTNWGSFRHIAYYLPEYRVYGLGFDRDGSYGHLFSARNGSTDYEVERLGASSQRLVLPPNVRRVIIPDATVAASFTGWQDLQTVELEDGTPITTARVVPGTVITFSRQYAVPAVESDPLVQPAGPVPVIPGEPVPTLMAADYRASHSGTGRLVQPARPAFSPM
ncbi:MAG: ArnT family glycosyltransferase [Candidatus Fermentibacterota bacterium]